MKNIFIDVDDHNHSRDGVASDTVRAELAIAPMRTNFGAAGVALACQSAPCRVLVR